MVQLPWKIVWRLLKKLKVELQDDPAVSLLGILILICCREEPVLTPFWKCFFDLLFIAVVTIIIHNDLPQRTLFLKKKKCKKEKWLPEEVFQIAEKRREVKGKGKTYPSERRVPKDSNKS